MGVEYELLRVKIVLREEWNGKELRMEDYDKGNKEDKANCQYRQEEIKPGKKTDGEIWFALLLKYCFPL